MGLNTQDLMVMFLCWKSLYSNNEMGSWVPKSIFSLHDLYSEPKFLICFIKTSPGRGTRRPGCARPWKKWFWSWNSGLDVSGLSHKVWKLCAPLNQMTAWPKQKISSLAPPFCWFRPILSISLLCMCVDISTKFGVGQSVDPGSTFEY